MSKTKLQVLKEIVPELDRFRKKLAIAIKDLEKHGDSWSQNHDYAAARRSALDLKRELTKLTQDSKYRYQ